MMTLVQQQAPQRTLDEHILVVKRDNLFGDEPAWQGLRVLQDFEPYIARIRKYQEFHARSRMEQDPGYKQIIPYLVFHHNNKFFLMQRQEKATEQRLKSKYSLGIGGHIRSEDLAHGDIVAWSHREFNEEVSYSDKLSITPLGILNDDSNEVGKVHIGFVFLFEGATHNIKVKSELKSGQLLSIDECKLFYDRMESWSKLVFDALQAQYPK